MKEKAKHTSCWAVSDGAAGMENQAVGLAEAMGLVPEIRRVQPRQPWRLLSPWLRLGLSHAYPLGSDRPVAPWPDLLIGCGRASIPASLLARRASAGGCYTVQIIRPQIASDHFDLVITPQHDQLTGTNVINTLGALHRVTPDRLAAEAARLAPQLADLPRPWIAVLIGASNDAYRLTPSTMVRTTLQLANAARAVGGSLLVTPSRRTSPANTAVLRAILHDCPAAVWDMAGDNPYFGFLGLADQIVVTSDSVNMTCEALSTGKPVQIIDLPGPGSEKFRRFHAGLRERGLARPFEGRLEQWQYPPLREMERVAALVWQHLAAHTQGRAA